MKSSISYSFFMILKNNKTEILMENSILKVLYLQGNFIGTENGTRCPCKCLCIYRNVSCTKRQEQKVLKQVLCKKYWNEYLFDLWFNSKDSIGSYTMRLLQRARTASGAPHCDLLRLARTESVMNFRKMIHIFSRLTTLSMCPHT